MNLESSKNLGGIGAIILLIGVLPIVGTDTFGIIALVGLILMLVAMRGLADYFKENRILTNFLYSAIIIIVGVAVTAATFVYLFFYTTIVTDFLYKIFPTWDGKWTSLSGLTPVTTGITPSDVIPFIGAVIAVLAIIWIFLIIGSYFARRSLKTLSTKTNVGLLSTGSLLLLIGAVLTIIGIGIFLIWVALILIAIGLFQIKTQLEQPLTSYASAPPTSPTPV